MDSNILHNCSLNSDFSSETMDNSYICDNASFDVHGRILELLSESNMTAYKLAKICNVPRSTVSRWINSEHCMTLKSIEILCNGLNISLSNFFRDKNIQEIIDFNDVKLKTSWNQLSEEKKATVLDFMEFIASKKSC